MLSTAVSPVSDLQQITSLLFAWISFMYERDITQNCLQRMQISTTEKLLYVIYKLINLLIDKTGFCIYHLKGQEKIEQNN